LTSYSFTQANLGEFVGVAMSLFSVLGKPSRGAASGATSLEVAGAQQTRTSSLGVRDAFERQVLDLAASHDYRPVFVAVFGLDRFDRLRAVAGHSLVADLICQLATRLSIAQPDWRIAPVGDDVLAAAFQAEDAGQAEVLVQGARDAMQGAYPLSSTSIDVRLSAGLSAAGPPGALLREGDIALDTARTEHVGFKVFDPLSHARAVSALALMPELRAAIEANELTLVHQPKYDLRTGAVGGVETLVRWMHPRYGLIEPDVFIRLAEETADILALTRWVMERAIEEQAELSRAGFPLQFAVNLSGRLVSDEPFIDWILDRKSSQQGALRLEITETAVIDNPEQAVRNIARLAAAGVPCSIDDYGAGLSSLAYLKRLEADELKLDKSLVDDVTRSRRDALITRSVVDLAHSLGMRVVAEGVETGESAAIVTAMGCDLGQGYFFCRPVALKGLIDQLTGSPRQTTQRSA
jgi:EAL domain-containing protein (putative c-di-GMP-specific phosphodiesterase class I)/GGDEF domain-containing protein